MIAPEFMEDIKFYARNLVKVSMTLVGNEKHRDDFKDSANRFRVKNQEIS